MTIWRMCVAYWISKAIWAQAHARGRTPPPTCTHANARAQRYMYYCFSMATAVTRTRFNITLPALRNPFSLTRCTNLLVFTAIIMSSNSLVCCPHVHVTLPKHMPYCLRSVVWEHLASFSKATALLVRNHLLPRNLSSTFAFLGSLEGSARHSPDPGINDRLLSRPYSTLMAGDGLS